MKQPKIYIDGLALVEGHFSGVGQYILGIVRGLDTLIEKNQLAGGSNIQVCVVIPHDMVPRFRSFGFKHVGYKTVPFSFRVMSILWHRGMMPPLDLFCGKGFYIFTRFVSMPLLFSKSAAIIFDLSYELHKEYSDDKNARFLSKGVRKTLAKVDKAIVISQSVKKELADFYNYPKSKIAVAYPAADQNYFYKRSAHEVKNVTRKYGIKGAYILTLSNLEPRKNLDGVVDAYCDLPKSITDKVSLLLVGVNGWKTEKLTDKITGKVNQGFNILRPSRYVSDDDKPAIISGAKLLVYPSHYEGFGMPPLEALACGVPVITSDNSSLPEVVKGVGAMVQSTDTTAITNAIKDSLGDWQKLSDKVRIDGPEQASKFSWTDSAKVVLDAARESYK